MGVLQKLFGNTKLYQKYTTFKELGSYRAIFSPFGGQIYKSELVRACIRPLAEQTSKANPHSSDKRIEKLLTYTPNPFMNGKDFLAKCRNILEVKNTLFVYIVRDDRGRASGFYPVPYATYEAVEYQSGLFIKFTFSSNAMKELIVPWADLAVARKDYLFSDIGGEDNAALLPTLEMINTTNQGVANAVKSTSNLRGILKNTKSMLDSEDIKKSRDLFVQEYLSLENAGGIAALDPTMEFIPITMSPVVTTYDQMKEFRENVYRYFGVNEHIVEGCPTEEEQEAFYQQRIEPFLVALSLEFTKKVFTERELGFGAFIEFAADRLQFASSKTKLSLVSMVDRGAMTPNEWRAVFNLPAIEGGDLPIRRLDTAAVDPDGTTVQEEEPAEEPADEPAEEPAEEETDDQR